MNEKSKSFTGAGRYQKAAQEASGIPHSSEQAAAAMLVPPELVELLDVLARLGKHVPIPAMESGSAGWERRREVEDRRRSTVHTHLDNLAVTIKTWNDAPDLMREPLAKLCREWAEQARARLAEPLGYEPAPAKVSELSTDGSLPSVYSSPGLSRG